MKITKFVISEKNDLKMRREIAPNKLLKFLHEKLLTISSPHILFVIRKMHILLKRQKKSSIKKSSQKKNSLLQARDNKGNSLVEHLQSILFAPSVPQLSLRFLKFRLPLLLIRSILLIFLLQ